MFAADVAAGNAYEYCEVQPFEPFAIGGYNIHPMLAEHGDEDENCFIYAIESGEKAFLLGNDTNIFPDATWEYLNGLKFDAAALDTTTGVNPPKPPGQSGHMDITAVKGVKDRMIKIGCANGDTVFVMNHFSHNGGLMHHEFEALGSGLGLIPAYDGYVLEI
jgi:phosphoribosyl 1,2-cyclic phosphate phosphodiesterase